MTPAAAFALLVSSVDSYDIVALTGEIDVTNAATLVTSVDDVPGRRPLITDLSGLRYLDSAGFAAIFQMIDQHAIIVVVDPNSPIRATATLTDLPCHDSVEAAITSQQTS